MNAALEGCKRQHIRELKLCVMTLDGKEVGNSFFFSGRPPFYPKWLEVVYDPWPRNEGLEVGLFRWVAGLLGPGGRLFVVYLKDEGTRKLLTYGANPAETPLGLSLLRAGFTWFKDWYFPEGGAEGGMKLQANLPLNDEDAVRQLRNLLSEVKSEETRKVIEEQIAERQSRSRTL